MEVPDSSGTAKTVPIRKLKVAVMPDTLVTPKGNILTKQQFLDSAKQGLPFTDMKTMGDWVDGWAKPTSQQPPPSIVAPQVKQDYYQGYTTPGSGSMRYHQ